MYNEIPARETGIPCFECGERSGLDCPGRKPDEATRCQKCLEIFLEQAHKKQIEHFRDLIQSFRDNEDSESENKLWSAMSIAERKDVLWLLADDEHTEMGEGS
jgi:hypothetical protein